MGLRGNLLIPAPHGQLEAIYSPKSESAERVALVLHPHPQYSGTMHNRVVYRAARALEAAGFAALRFNFRGVGRSSGSFAGGSGELEDAHVALDYLLEHQPRAREVLVAGFSFGAAIGLRLGCADRRVHRLIAIGTPALQADLSFLSDCERPMLFVHGEKDEIAPLAPLEKLLGTLPPTANCRLVRIPGAGHFFDDQLERLVHVITEYAARKTPSP